MEEEDESALVKHGTRPTVPKQVVSALYWSPLRAARWLTSRIWHRPKRVAAAVAVKRTAMNMGLRRRQTELMRSREIIVHVCTWNVGLQTPPADLREWLGLNHSSTAAAIPDMVAVCLQETELSGAALMLEVTDAHVTWLEAITHSLNDIPGLAEQRLRYRKVEIVQLVGLVLILLIRSDHFDEVRNVRKAITRTGALSIMGNKGAIGIRATVHGKRFLFVGAHFSPHEHNAAARNADYRSCLAELTLDGGDVIDDEVDFCRSLVGQGSSTTRKVHGSKIRDRMLRRRKSRDNAARSGFRLINSHDYVFFAGDLNYRLTDIGHDEAVFCAKNGHYDRLLEHDELRQGMRNGLVFCGFKEPPVDFPPTYKYDMGTNVFDTSAKNRTPAYTDRVLFRHRCPGESLEAPFAPDPSLYTRLLRGVAGPCFAPAGVSAEQSNATESSSDVDSAGGLPYIPNNVTVDRYCSVQSYLVSDHKPVGAAFRVTVAEKTDNNIVQRIVFEVMQEVGFEDPSCCADELDFVADEPHM